MFIGATHTPGSATLGPILGSNSDEIDRLAEQQQKNWQDYCSKFLSSLESLTDTDKQKKATKVFNDAHNDLSVFLKVAAVGASIMATGVTLGVLGFSHTVAVSAIVVGFLPTAIGAMESASAADKKNMVSNYLKENFPSNDLVKSFNPENVKNNISSIRDKIFGAKNENDTALKLK